MCIEDYTQLNIPLEPNDVLFIEFLKGPFFPLNHIQAELDEFDETVPLVQEQTGALTVVTTSAPTTETADSEEPSVLGGSSSDPLARFAAARLRQQVLGQSLDSSKQFS
ncbi:unnamed protein product [Protopolystoma xenopodis]|uniref:Uncharacterized protein n=1 Tax=Protopolystoma xenopodis TaxID=117903 RepID=A0A3S5CUE5_9PLAT|nr:unnamed protein product [Protopolystoma xenopodis]